jgi:H+/Cl- antiporter ClcA
MHEDHQPGSRVACTRPTEARVTPSSTDASSDAPRTARLAAYARTITRRHGLEYASHLRYVARWLVLIVPVAVLIGSAVALFLWSLDLVTAQRWSAPWLVWLLPLGGVAIGLLYHTAGRSAEGGNNLIVDEIHQPTVGVPARMAPLVLLGTLGTHLFGGSAGREGTAVQMGASIASTAARVLYDRLAAALAWFRLDAADRRMLLQAGVAAGFGAVFGTPIAGAIFALEVLAIGRMTYAALIPCLMASLIGDWATSAWGIHHTAYPLLRLDALGVGRLDPLLLVKVTVAAAAFGLASTLFAETTHGLARLFRRLAPVPWLRPALGGVLVLALMLLVGSRDYLGLGVTTADGTGVSIVNSFEPGGIAPWSWALKLLFTAVTISTGFKGGEVTPLFFIGATLGHTLGAALDAPIALFAAIGFVAVFAGATNTPLACTIMGVELFGAEIGVYLATGCFLAYLFSGHSSIYAAQRLAVPKGRLQMAGPQPAADGGDSPLREVHARDVRTSRGG